MGNVFRIKTSSTTPTLVGKEGLNILKIGEFGYSYADGDSAGGDRLFIGIGPQKANGYANEYVTIGGQHYVEMLDHPEGKLHPSSAIITDANNKIDKILIDNISIDGNTISTTDPDGNIILDPNGTGFIDASTSIISNVVDPVQAQDAATKRYVDTRDVAFGNADENVSGDGNIPMGGEIQITGDFNTNTKRIDLANGVKFKVNLDSNVSGLASLEVDNVKIDGNTISTTNGELVIDPTPVGGAGKVTIQGDLQVDGTTTTINSTELTVNDKNLVLADNATSGVEADSAGITIGGALAQIIYKNTLDIWLFNRKVQAPNIKLELPDGTPGTFEGKYAGFDSDFSEKSTDSLNEGDINLYYTQARFDSDFGTKSTANIPESTNLYYTTARSDSDFDVRLALKSTSDLAEGSNLYHTVQRVRDVLSVKDAGGDGSFAYDSATGQFTYTGPSASEIRAHLSASGAIQYDSSTGQFSLSQDAVYSSIRADSDARHALSAAGDLSYDPNTGVFSFDVEQVYTKANFDSDLDEALASGTGITYDASANTINITNTGVTAGTYGSASEVPVFRVNAQGQLDSAGTITVAGVSATSIDSSTGDFTINTADGGVFTSRLYDANILNNDGNKAGITWTVSGATDQYRTANNFVDSDLEVYTIREMNFTGNKLRIEVAQFSPGLTATGQSNLDFDEKATQFSVAIDNPVDFTTRFINSVSSIAQTNAYVGTTLANYNAGAKSQTPAGGVDWTQAFTFDSASGAAVRDNSTTISGGTSIGEITFGDDQGADFSTTASFTTTWKTPNVSISMSNLSGNQFLETYTSTSYNVSVSGMQSSSNITHTVAGTGGSISSSNGSGTITFTNPIHKDNGGGRQVAVSTEFRRPPGVATTSYSVTDTASDITLSANFTYPTLTMFTAGAGTPPTRADVVNNDQFESAVTELSNQTKNFTGTVNNPGSVPKCFWFMVRSAATQPSTFQTGASASLLSDVGTTNTTLDLEPDSPPSGYSAETYNLYGIVLQPGNTYVSIS